MKVAILGGGFCGSSIAKQLDKKDELTVTLIDKNPYFEYIPSAHKCLTNPDYQHKIRIPFKNFLSNVTIINESIKRVLPFEVQTDSKRIEFDSAVCCMGSSYPIHLLNTTQVYTMTNSKQAVKIFQKLKNAQTVLIIGGGYIGTEIAAEITTKQSDLQVIMVHAKDRILPRSPKYASNYAMKFLKKRGITFLFNDTIVKHPSKREFITTNGKRIDADVCIWCAGLKVDTSYLEGFPSNTTNAHNQINVNDYLQFVNYSHIFAGGDVIASDEEKTAQKAELHAQIIATNIQRLQQGKSLVLYNNKINPMVVSLGDTHGIFFFDRFVLPGMLAGYAKWIVEWWTLRQIRTK